MHHGAMKRTDDTSHRCAVLPRKESFQRTMHGNPHGKKYGKLLKESNAFLRCYPRTQAQNAWEMKNTPLLDRENRRAALHDHPRRCRRAFCLDTSVHLLSICCARCIRIHRHARIPRLLSSSSAASIVCIPCALPLIMSAVSCS